MTTIRHLGIVVSDMAASLGFYRDLIGLREAPVHKESGDFLDGLLAIKGAVVSTVKLAGKDGPCLLELLCFEAPGPADPRPLNAIGPTHIALTVDDLDGLYARIVAAGYHFNAPPRVAPDGAAKVAFCRDPDGAYVELVEPLAAP